MVVPAARRSAVSAVREAHGISEGRARALLGADRSIIRYRFIRPDEGNCEPDCAAWRASDVGLATSASACCWRARGYGRTTRSCGGSIARSGCKSVVAAGESASSAHGRQWRCRTRVEKGNVYATHERGERIRPSRPAGRRAQHHYRPLGFQIIAGARSSAAGCAIGMSIGCCCKGGRSGACSPAMSSGSSRCTGPGRSCCATRKASRTKVGIVAGLTSAARVWSAASCSRRCLRSGNAPACW